MKKSLMALLLAATLCSGAHAQSEASLALSALPIASVVATASVGAAAVGTVSAIPVVLSAAGAVFVIKAVEVTARGTLYLLERASDGAQVSVEVAASGVGAASLGVGAAITTSVLASGVVLSAAGEAIAFIPNALGRALLHNERIAP